MERYITSEEADTLLTTFCQLGDLDDFDSELVKEALNNPKSFCLKILREGGAEGNLFGEEIIPKLEEMKTNKDERKMYILMKRIEPDTKPNVLGQFYFLKCSAEDPTLKDRPFILTSRHGLKPGIFLRMWMNRLFCFLQVPSTTNG